MAKARLALPLYPEHHTHDKWGFCGTWYWYEYMLNELNAIVLDSQQTYDQHKHEITAIWDGEFGSPRLQYDVDRKHKIALLLSDPHDPKKKTWVMDYIDNNNITYVLTPYYAPTRMHFPLIPSHKVIRFPWCIPDQFIATPDDMKFFHSDKEQFHNTIYIYGSMAGHPAYNAREWCAQFPFVTNAHHGRNNRILTREEYWTRLKTYDAAIAAGSFWPKYGLVVPKYYEIAAAGSLLFAQDYPNGELAALGFNDTNCVPFTQQSFPQDAIDYLCNPKVYQSRRLAGVKLIRDRHSLSVRAAELAELLEL